MQSSIFRARFGSGGHSARASPPCISISFAMTRHVVRSTVYTGGALPRFSRTYRTKPVVYCAPPRLQYGGGSGPRGNKARTNVAERLDHTCGGLSPGRPGDRRRVRDTAAPPATRPARHPAAWLRRGRPLWAGLCSEPLAFCVTLRPSGSGRNDSDLSPPVTV